MIKDFRISNFRQFDELNINTISRINLFVGKNSAGKSALLEALLLFFSQMSDKYLPGIHISRQETWDQRGGGEQSPLRHLFAQHKLPGIGEPGFQLSSSNDPRSFEVRTAAYTRDDETVGPVYKLVEAANIEEADPDLYETFLVLAKPDHNRRLARTNSSINDLRRRSLHARRMEGRDSCFYIPTRGLEDSGTAFLWDSISLTDSEAEVIKGLQLIEPRVEGVAFVASEERDGRIPLVKILGNSEPFPLKSLGDGMSRIFQIVLSLVNAKDSILLIDEFETGLHWGVQEEVWGLVFQLSEKLNVQVFATTHSRDCIKGFENAWSRAPQAGSFARINKINNKVTLKEYDLELLQDSLMTDVEVR